MHVKNTQLLSIAAALACFLAAGNAMALSIPELEPNDTLATAQNIDPFFSVGPNVNILNSTTVPWVSISGTGDETFDYYSFTVNSANTAVHLDIDFGSGVGGSIDTQIALWDSVGNVLASNDDSALDPGSVSVLDAEIFFNIVSPGLYIVGVAEFPATALFGGWSGNEPPSDTDYVLQVSVVPEPGATILFGIGALLAGLALRRKA